MVGAPADRALPVRSIRRTGLADRARPQREDEHRPDFGAAQRPSQVEAITGVKASHGVGRDVHPGRLELARVGHLRPDRRAVRPGPVGEAVGRPRRRRDDAIG